MLITWHNEDMLVFTWSRDYQYYVLDYWHAFGILQIIKIQTKPFSALQRLNDSLIVFHFSMGNQHYSSESLAFVSEKPLN